MPIELSTPALLFSTVSLLILAFNNRFISIAQLIRELIGRYKLSREEMILFQITKLNRRANIIKYMQIIAVFSLLLSVVTMFLLFYNQLALAQISFSFALILLVVAMSFAIYELILSTNALSILVDGIEELK